MTRAYQWLLTHNVVHAKWCAEQEEVVRNGTERRLYPSALLRPFLECVLWPGVGTEGYKYDSAKADFVTKATCPYLDNGSNYELLQFQFHRYVLRTVMLSTRSAIGNEVKAQATTLDQAILAQAE